METTAKSSRGGRLNCLTGRRVASAPAAALTSPFFLSLFDVFVFPFLFAPGDASQILPALSSSPPSAPVGDLGARGGVAAPNLGGVALTAAAAVVCFAGDRCTRVRPGVLTMPLARLTGDRGPTARMRAGVPNILALVMTGERSPPEPGPRRRDPACDHFSRLSVSNIDAGDERLLVTRVRAGVISSFVPSMRGGPCTADEVDDDTEAAEKRGLSGPVGEE